jgi:hypothetical protein
MANVFDIETLRDARQYLEGAYVPRKYDGMVVHIERIYGRNEGDNGLDNLGAIVVTKNSHDQVPFRFEDYDWEATPRLGLSFGANGNLYYSTINTDRQWKKVLSSQRVFRQICAPALTGRALGGVRGMSLDAAEQFFYPEFTHPQAAIAACAAGTKSLHIISPVLYVARTPAGPALGYHTRLIGKLDMDGTAHLHTRAAALKDIVSDHFTIGGDL